MEKLLTIFSLPKPFTDPHIATIQRNAIASWVAVEGAQVFLLGKDQGIAEVAQELGCTHVPDVVVSEFGTPMLDSAFAIAHERANTPYLMYINADIMLPSDFANVLPQMPQKPFLAVGQRTDLDVQQPALSAADRAAVFVRAKTEGSLHSVQGIDYFLFRRNQFPPIASFAVGRSAFDNWLLRTAKVNRLALVDLTSKTVVHQNHPPAPQNAGRARKEGPEARRNISHMKRKTWYYTIGDANWRLTQEGLRYNWLHWRPYLKRFLKVILHR